MEQSAQTTTRVASAAQLQIVIHVHLQRELNLTNMKEQVPILPALFPRVKIQQWSYGKTLL